LQKIILNCYERVNNIEGSLKKIAKERFGEKGEEEEEEDERKSSPREEKKDGKKPVTYEEELEQAERDADNDAQIRHKVKTDPQVIHSAVTDEGLLVNVDDKGLIQDTGLEVIKKGSPVDYSPLFDKKKNEENLVDGNETYRSVSPLKKIEKTNEEE
jgi:hypothetical protein